MRARGRERDRSAPEGKAALLARFSAQMRATARRYSANGHDAEDAYQRAAEILLTHGPSGSDDEVCRWLRTTVKHEALAIRRSQGRVVPFGEPERLPEPRAEPDTEERAERLERLSVGAQALRRLKPQEIRCLTLRAEGYSYAEICELTGWTYTKVNRCLTEGRRAFLERVSGIESGAECDRLAPLLSALADGEAPAADLAQARSHLKSCPACRRRLAQVRDAPAKVAALAPAAAVASDGAGSARAWLESLLGAAQHRAAVTGERIHAAAELATGHKAAAVAASAAALAGGGVSVDRAREREPQAKPPAAEAKRAKPRPVAPAAPTPPAQTAATPAAAPPPAAPRPQPPAPDPAREFAPAAAAPAPSPPARAAGGGSPGGAEFGP